jgi:hypothetical protein
MFAEAARLTMGRTEKPQLGTETLLEFLYSDIRGLYLGLEIGIKGPCVMRLSYKEMALKVATNSP